MAGLLAALGGNPFATPVGQKIEQATDASLSSESWALNMEICDIINETDEGPKDAVKAIKKRIQQNSGKNYTVVLYTLTVLETCVKNCGKRFHLLVSQKDFVQDLVKLIGPKNDPPTTVQEKVLSLIQSWADAFHGNPDMQGVVQIYQDLKQNGIEFPMTDLDAMAPIYTPQRTVLPTSPLPHLPDQPPHAPESIEQPVQPQIMSPGTETGNVHSSSINLNQEQLTKLRSEIDVVQGNMKVFGEMLTELTPGHEHPQDLELLQDLQKTCYAMQNRIVELIEKVGNEEVTSELLRVNDELNNMFLRYERYEKKRCAMHSPPPVVSQIQPVEDLADKPLIDFGDSSESSTSDITSQLAEMSINNSTSNTLGQLNTVIATNQPTSTNSHLADEFDMFAQSRTASYEKNKVSGSSYADNSNPDQISIGLGPYAQNRGHTTVNNGEIGFEEVDAEKVSKWLDEKPEVKPESQNSTISSEFDRFLAERASAVDRVPVIATDNSPSPSIPSLPRSAASGISNRRQMDKEEAENALFVL